MSISVNETAPIVPKVRLTHKTILQEPKRKETWKVQAITMLRSAALPIAGAAVMNIAFLQTAMALSYNSTGTPFTNTGLGLPTGIAVDSSGNVFVSNFDTATISKYTSNGTPSATFGSGASFAGIAISNDGSVLVTDTTNNKVLKYSSDGTTSAVFTSLDLANPFGIAVDSSGNVFVTNTSDVTKDVRKYSSNGTSLGIFANTTSGLSSPFGIAVDSSGNVFIGDIDTSKVLKYSNTGTLLQALTVGLLPNSIAIDSSGDILVADSAGDVVVRYDSTGVERQRLSGLTAPSALAIDRSNNLLVASFNENTPVITRFAGSLEPITPVPFGFSPLWALLPASIRCIIKRLQKRK
ncbi:NHL repeat-containing protein [Cyanobacteria bacterium FACHB-DQ100]|nr:NHL repeat-containing protein [Cyanobacteria bacterium FACHB-DQ100]